MTWNKISKSITAHFGIIQRASVPICLPRTFPLSTSSLTLGPAEKFNSLFLNQLKQSIRKTDKTKEEESVHSGNLISRLIGKSAYLYYVQL